MKTCEHSFHADHGMGCHTAVLTGSSYANHVIMCEYSLMNWGRPETIMGGPFRKVTDYAPWEAPAGECPICWHAKRTDRATLLNRITEYLSLGGLWNPEMMNHEKVRELIMDCRTYIERGTP